MLAPPLFADSLTLRDGSVIHGQFVSGTPQKIIFQDHNGVWRRFDVKQVRDIDFTPARRRGRGVRTAARRGTGRSAPAVSSRSATEEAIDPQDVVAGRTFLATVVDDIHGGNGNVIIPGGSPARIMLRPAAEAAASRDSRSSWNPW